MRSVFCLLTAALLLVFSPALPASAEKVILINEDLPSLSYSETMSMFSSAADAFYHDEALAAELNEELSLKEYKDIFDDGDEEVVTMGSLTHRGQTMRFLMDLIGEPDENGLYPLYITLHGGGESASELNDQQWWSMYYYYRSSVKNGIYIACRGITDTWDLHFRPESYPLYDRLIRAMVCLCQADPERVYLLGFSAGGDGVYQIAPRLADRFAAVNMSSGHPNGVSLKNLANCPISIQVGVRDYYSEDAMRCIRGAEFEEVLNEYHRQLDYGYEHQVLVHVPEGHNFGDWDETDAEVLADPASYADPAIREDMMLSFLDALSSKAGTDNMTDLSYAMPAMNAEFDQAVRRIVTEEFGLETVLADDSAVHYVSQFTRDPAPKAVVWDLGTRAALRESDSFYWLKADASVTEGIITARVSTEDNTVTLSMENVSGDFSILVNPFLLDVSRPIRIVTDEGEFEVHVNPSEETLISSIKQTGDPMLAWVAEIPYSMLH